MRTKAQTGHGRAIHDVHKDDNGYISPRCPVNNNRGGVWYEVTNASPVDCKKCIEAKARWEAKS